MWRQNSGQSRGGQRIQNAFHMCIKCHRTNCINKKNKKNQFYDYKSNTYF